jgi:hypothetical protein
MISASMVEGKSEIRSQKSEGRKKKPGVRGKHQMQGGQKPGRIRALQNPPSPTCGARLPYKQFRQPFPLSSDF